MTQKAIRRVSQPVVFDLRHYEEASGAIRVLQSMDMRKKKAAVEFYSIATDDEEDDDGMKCRLMGGWKKWTRRKRRWKPIIVDSGADASIFLGYMLKQGRKAYRIITTSLGCPR